MVRIITDSAADLEPQEYRQLGVDCIPLRVMIGDQEYQENVDLSKDQFFELLARTGESPKTAQPSPQCLMELFEEAGACGDQAVYICLASALSGTYQSARMTLEEAEGEGLFVVDGRSATGGQRLLVEHAVRLRDRGASAEEIVEEVESLRERIVLYACMDTLEYLYRGGRISHTVYKLGTMAQVKPIIHVTAAGTIEVPAKAMGMRKGMDLLCRHILQQKPDGEHNLYVMYTADRTIGQALAKKIGELGFEVPEERIIQVGAGIGSHIGPNACGIVYIRE